ncbi:MAG: riboflavin synthase [Bordetella sp.]|nr:MAG: riboflavin synthase [Bordetella sp.]
MFTGIVESVGKIVDIKHIDEQSGLQLEIEARDLKLSDTKIGDSISVQGACMTVSNLNLKLNSFSVIVSKQSLKSTTGLNCINEVNLEKSLYANSRLGGHFLLGHIDSLGKIKSLSSVGNSLELVLCIQNDIARYLVYKGPIAVNGISLTINKIIKEKDNFEVSMNIIPHTIINTTIRNEKIENLVNIEVDILARYVENFSKKIL